MLLLIYLAVLIHFIPAQLRRMHPYMQPLSEEHDFGASLSSNTQKHFMYTLHSSKKQSLFLAMLLCPAVFVWRCAIP